MSTNFAPDAFDRAVIGVVGGMGPAATGQFLVELAAALPVEYDQDLPGVLVLSDTKVPDRTTCIAAGDPAPGTMVRADLLRAAQLGASVLAVPCNTVHYFIDDFVDELPVPLVHIVDATITAAMQTSPEGAWLTATAGTVNTGLYQRLAAERDYPLKVPSDEEKAAMMEIIGEVKAGRMTRAGELYRALAGRLLRALGEHPGGDGAVAVGGEPKPYRQYLEGLYRRDRLAGLLGRVRVRDRGVARTLRVLDLVEVLAPVQQCRDVDSPEDLAWWAERLGG